ncbi:TVP38/TMEM64 family protein [Candidatus Nomurabacteria bacterium]|nr:TVP38/TMEM64 family protein [Candidatus Nomurabacteria bacterium]
MMQTIAKLLPAIGFVLVCTLLLLFTEPVAYMKTLVSGMNAVSYISYVLMLTLAIVLMPLTVMPLIPVASAVMGPFATALLSIVGWTLGGVLAFLIARYVGRPALERFVNLGTLDELTARIPQNSRFMVIVLLRLTLPVDIVSYAIGFTSSVSLLEYTLATLVGVTWFSFAFAYLGDALLTGNKPLLIELTGASLLIFFGAWLWLRRTHRRN